MKKLLLLTLLSLTSVAGDRQANDFTFLKMLNGAPAYRGVIVATTVKDNSNTAAAFTIVTGSLLQIQCDAAAYIGHNTAAAAAYTTAANGTRVEAYEKYFLLLLNSEAYVEALAVTGTANCKVWRMQ